MFPDLMQWCRHLQMQSKIQYLASTLVDGHACGDPSQKGGILPEIVVYYS